jgi:hypothetical protein
VGEYVIHFADAREQTVPLIYSVNTTDWMLSTNSATELTENTHVAWQGENASSRESGRVIRLFDFVWKNTRPDMDIICIDFKSNLSASAPFLLAITVE